MSNAATNTTAAITDGVGLAVETVKGWQVDFYAVLPNLLAGVIILLIFVLAAHGFKRLVIKYFDSRQRVDLGCLVADIAFWLVILIGSLIALTIITPSLKPVNLISGLGLGSLAIGFAFKDILQNWLAGLLILLRLPFRRGDQIQINDIEGTVQRIEPRATIIRTYDGKDIVVPNTTVYTSEITIHTSQPKRRVEISITVGYDYDIEFIKQIIEEALKPIEEILDSPEPQILPWNLGATSLELKIRWWISSERSEEVISRARAIQAIKEAFQANQIDPTDPALVYSVQATPAPTNGDDNDSVPAGKSGKGQQIKRSTPPPELEMGPDDPETYTVKQDSKDFTLLPDD